MSSLWVVPRRGSPPADVVMEAKGTAVETRAVEGGQAGIAGPHQQLGRSRVNDSNDIWGRAEAIANDGPPAPTSGGTARRAAGSQKAKIAGALILGGVAGAAILGPIATLAASPSPAASSGTGSGSTGTGATGTATPDADPSGQPDHGPGGPGGHTEAGTDTALGPKAIGISEADLLTALQGGQTVAAVAKAHNVDLQVVIDALVADGQSELDAAVKAGTMTQAQADAEKTELTQRATDQANGTFDGRHGN